MRRWGLAGILSSMLLTLLLVGGAQAEAGAARAILGAGSPTGESETLTAPPWQDGEGGECTYIIVHKFNDMDANGVQDPGEESLAGWTMTLYRWSSYSNSWRYVATQVTDSAGDAIFSDPPTGYTYRAEEMVQSGWINTTPNPSASVYLGSGQTKTIRFGNVRTELGSLGDCVWHDDDRDGNGPDGCTAGPDYDNGENLIPNVGVQLSRVTAPNTLEPLGIRFTDSAGHYVFTDLPAGAYVVDVLEPGVFNYFGGPFVLTTVEPYAYALAQGEHHRNADFGYDNANAGGVLLGDWVWYDIDANAQQNDGALLYQSPYVTMYDTGIPCVEVKLWVGPNANNRTLIGAANTDEWGTYSFPLLIPNAAGQLYFTSVDVDVNEDPDVASFMDYYKSATPGHTCNLATEWVNPDYVFGSSHSVASPRDPEQATTPPLRSTSLPDPGDFDLTLDFGFTDVPLAVILAGFQAQAQAGHVAVTWETTSEVGNAGFNLYRSDNATGPMALLAYLPSQGPGSVQGFAYSYDDFSVQVGRTYWYWLEEVGLSGAMTIHGPVSATASVPSAVMLGEFEAGRATRPVPLIAPALVVALLAGAARLVRRRKGRAM